MLRKLDQDEFYVPPGTPLYNACFKGGALQRSDDRSRL